MYRQGSSQVLLRVNPGVDAHTHEYIQTSKNDSKFGESIFSDEIKKYSRETKLKAIKRVYEGESQREVAIDLGLAEATTIRDWLRIYKSKGEEGIKDSYSRSYYLMYEDRLDKIAVDSLKDRNEYLEAENEYLKKLYSLILEKKK